MNLNLIKMVEQYNTSYPQCVEVRKTRRKHRKFTSVCNDPRPIA